MAGNQVRVGVGVSGVGKASSDLDKLKDRFERLQKQGAKGFAIGAGAAITAKGLGLLDQAASGAIGALGDMVEKALADEESVNRLNASLKTNVAGWDGDTSAIEANILAKQRIGFQDEQLRDSLTVLLGATHDVTKAQEIQAIAMDLARFKGIDLQTASESLIKVEAGVYRSLKSLGIVLKDGATQTEALAAVQKVAKGQAEAYAQTNRGKLEASQIKVGEAMEKLGGIIMPAAVTAMLAAGDAATELAKDAGPVVATLTDIADAGQHVIETMDHLVGADSQAAGESDLLGSKTDALGQAIHGAAYALDLMANNLADVADGGHRVDDIFAAQAAAANDVGIAMDLMGVHAAQAVDDVSTAGGGIADTFKTLQGASKSATKHIILDIGDVADAFDKTWSELAGTAEQAAEDIFGPMERRAELAANKAAQAADLGTLAHPKKGDDLEAVRADLLGLQKDYFTLMAQMAGRGELTAGEIKKLNDALKDELKTASNEETVSILALISLLDRLRGKSQGLFGGGNRNQAGSGPLMGGRASGGAVPPYWTGMVGERGPEQITMGPVGGNVTPLGGSDASAQWLPVIAGYMARIAADQPMVATPQTARGSLARQSALMPGGRL